MRSYNPVNRLRIHSVPLVVNDVPRGFYVIPVLFVVLPKLRPSSGIRGRSEVPDVFSFNETPRAWTKTYVSYAHKEHP